VAADYDMDWKMVVLAAAQFVSGEDYHFDVEEARLTGAGAGCHFGVEVACRFDVEEDCHFGAGAGCHFGVEAACRFDVEEDCLTDVEEDCNVLLAWNIREENGSR
jgi:hypothetical protein